MVVAVHRENHESHYECESYHIHPIKGTGNSDLVLDRPRGAVSISLDEGSGIKVFVMNNEGRTINRFEY